MRILGLHFEVVGGGGRGGEKIPGQRFTSISSLVLALWQFYFIIDWPEIYRLWLIKRKPFVGVTLPPAPALPPPISPRLWLVTDGRTFHWFIATWIQKVCTLLASLQLTFDFESSVLQGINVIMALWLCLIWNLGA